MHKNNVDNLSKTPPEASEIEQALLGSVILCESLEYCYKTIKSEDFYNNHHQIIYQAMEQLHNLRQPINIQTISHLLRTNGQIELIGGNHYLTELTYAGMMVPHKIDYYAKIVHQTWIARKLIELSYNIQKKSYDITEDISDTIDYAINTINEIQTVNIFNIPKILHYERVFIKGMIINAEMFLEYKSNIPDDLFFDKTHQKIWNVMKLLSDSNIEISPVSIEDVLEVSVNKSIIPYFKELIEQSYKEEGSFEYLLSYLKKYYDKIQLTKIYDFLRLNRYEKEPEQILEKMDLMMDSLRTKNIQSINFSDHLDSTFTDIISKSKDGNKAILKTGFQKLDSVAMFSTNDIVMIGGARGTGKTRIAIKIINSILTLNENTAACIICMEETIEKVQRIFLSIETGLTDSELQSKYYTLTDDDKQKLLEAKNKLKNLDIEIIAHPVSIKQAASIYSKFTKKRPTKRPVFILDNIMLLEENNSRVDADDMIAKQIVYIKKKTGALFFVLHHFTKEQESYINAQEAYRPKEGHLKGSSRYTDIADHVWLLNYVSKYGDLIKNESIKPPIIINDLKYKREAVLKKLLVTEFTKNRDGDNDEKLRLIRFFIDLGKMKFSEWK
jgi:replicative DNA helicase